MAGDVINLVAQATTSSAWVDAPVLREVPASEAARFTDVLQSNDPSAQQVPAASAADAGAGHMGDAILSSLEGLGREYAAKSERITAALTPDSDLLSVSELLRLQLAVADSSMFVELVGKAVSKATQHIDQLTKLQ
jgi:type III secretion system YscI/HrpB-like protein